MPAVALAPPKHQAASLKRAKNGFRQAPVALIGADWQKARAAFVQRDVRPMLQDISIEFNLPYPQLCTCSSDQGWPMQRVRFIEAQLERADAAEILAQSIGISRAITSAAENVGLVALQKVAECLESVTSKTAASSRASVLNTLGFAFANFTKGLKDLGIAGFGGKLDDNGKGANGHWNPKLLQQINVVVQNLQEKQAVKASLAGTDGLAVPVSVDPEPVPVRSVTTDSEPATESGGDKPDSDPTAPASTQPPAPSATPEPSVEPASDPRSPASGTPSSTA